MVHMNQPDKLTFMSDPVLIRNEFDTSAIEFLAVIERYDIIFAFLSKWHHAIIEGQVP